MNLLLLTDWTYPCDHQFLTHVYAENFLDRGHEVTWVMRPENSGHSAVEHHTWNGADVYVLPDTAFDPIRNYLRYRLGRINRNAVFSLGLDFDDFDVVHVRNDLPMGMVAHSIKQNNDVAFAHQISHCKAEALIEAHNRGFDSRRAWMRGQLGKRLRHRIADTADVVLPISEAMMTVLEEYGYSTPMEVLPTGAPVVDTVPDIDEFRGTYDVTSQYVIMYMGSMSPYRRLEFLFDVLASLEEYDVELLMLGGRREKNRQRLIELAEEKSVSSSVTFTGWIEDRTVIQQAIATADVGLSPMPTDSILRTNAPIKTLEYLSLGTPVVASNTPDQVTVLEDSGGGYAVEYDVTSFTEAVSELLSSPTTAEQMSHSGREYIKSNRNFEVLTDRVEEIYEQLIEDGYSIS